MQSNEVTLEALECGVAVACEGDSDRLLKIAYAEFLAGVASPLLSFRIRSRDATYVLETTEEPALEARTDSRLIAVVDDLLVLSLQKLRSDLLFLHAAVLEYRGRAILLLAASGGGKSTTAWGLSHHGFDFLSDELAPIDLSTMTVHPYPRALCLKSEPPVTYPVPVGAFRATESLHVPGDALPCAVVPRPLSIGACFFVRFDAAAAEPRIEEISTARGGARMYAQTLNALAHPNDGIDGALAVADASVCYELVSAELTSTVELIESTVATCSGSW